MQPIIKHPGRFYNSKEDFSDFNISYFKHACEGHHGAPDEAQVATFIKICNDFWVKNPGKTIGVHCTHGFNRTGFLITSYLIKELDTAPDAAAWSFRKASHKYKKNIITHIQHTHIQHTHTHARSILIECR